MTNWHAHPSHLTAYAEGELVGPSADSIEAHLLTCAECRLQLSERVPVSEEVWNAISLAVEEPPRSMAERILVRLGCPDHTARMLAATPALRASWLLAVMTTLALAAIAARIVPGERGFAVYLVVAPLVPLVGIAAAYSGGTRTERFMDELILASPTQNEHLLLLRAVAVLVVSCGLVAGAAAVGLAHLGWMAAGWLLPALALASATLALATAVPLRLAATGCGGAWLLVTTLAVRSSAAPLSVFGDATQLASLAAALAGAVVLSRRHTRFDLGGSR